MRRFLLVMAMLCLIVWGSALYLLLKSSERATAALPTLMVLPSHTPER